MPNERSERPPEQLPRNREELAEYLDEVLALTGSWDTTAWFLLRLTVKAVRQEERGESEPNDARDIAAPSVRFHDPEA
jgi:hypothetical protein